MAERKEDIRLKKIRDSGGKLYSISRLNTMNQCPYQAYLKYVKKEEEKNKGIYGILGGTVHDCIEECIHGTKELKDIKIAIQQELNDIELFGIEFPKDRNGNTTIRDNWVSNMLRFSDEFNIPTGKIATEKLLIYQLDDKHYMMGYADAIKRNEDGSVWLIDWKSSSKYTGKHILEAGRQLIIYKLALEKMGYKVSRCSWCMMKYCETSWTLKNGKTKTKVTEWRNLIKDMSSNIEKSLSDLGYDEVDIEIMIDEGTQKNSWLVFPQEIQDKFTTKVYYQDYEITEDLIEETLDYIKSIINKFETYGECEAAYKSCNVEKESFFCNALCGYGGKTGQCKYYVDFCNQFEKEDKNEDLF